MQGQSYQGHKTSLVTKGYSNRLSELAEYRVKFIPSSEAIGTHWIWDKSSNPKALYIL